MGIAETPHIEVSSSRQLPLASERCPLSDKRWHAVRFCECEVKDL